MIYWIKIKSIVIAFYFALFIWFVLICLIMDFINNDFARIILMIMVTIISFIIAISFEYWIDKIAYKIITNE